MAAGDNISLNVQNTGSGRNIVQFLGVGDYAGLLGGSGYAVIGSNGTVNTSSNTAFTLTGDNNVVQGASGDDVELVGSSNLINAGTATSGNIVGTANTLNEGGNGTRFNLQNTGSGIDIVNFEALNDYAGLLGGAGYLVNGSNGTIDTAAQTSFYAVGDGNNISLAAGSSVAITGTGILVGGAVAGTKVDLGANTSATVLGNGGLIAVDGTNIQLTTSNEGVQAVADATFSLSGSNDGIGLGTGSTLFIAAGAGNYVEAAATSAVNLASNTSTTVDGSGGSVGIFGTSIQVTASNEGVQSIAGATFSLSGSNDGIGLGTGSTLFIAAGAGNYVEAAATSAVNLASNTSTTVDGSGGSVGIFGTNIQVTASNEGVQSIAGATFSLSGSNDGIGLGAGSTLAIIAGTGNYVAADASSAVNLASNTSTTIDAAGGSIGIYGTGIQVTASGETVRTIGNTSLNLVGSSNLVASNAGDEVSVTGGNNTITGTSDELVSVAGTNGSADTIDINGDQIGCLTSLGNGTGVFLASNTQASLNGNGNGVILTTGDLLAVTTGSGNNVYNNVYTNIVNLGSNTSTTIAGSGGTFGIAGTNVAVDTSGEYEAAAVGSSFTLAGNDNSVTLTDGVTASLAGNNNYLAGTLADPSASPNSGNSLVLADGIYQGSSNFTSTVPINPFASGLDYAIDVENSANTEGEGFSASTDYNSSTGSTYNSFNSVGGGTSASTGTGVGTGYNQSAPTLPASISNPTTGREDANAVLGFRTFDGAVLLSGTAQSLLSQLGNLFKKNNDRTQGLSGSVNPQPALVLPNGSLIRFASEQDLQNYVVRSAVPAPQPPSQPASPNSPPPIISDADLVSAFTSVLGHAPTAPQLSFLQNETNNGVSYAGIRANLAGGQEATNDIDGIYLRILRRDPTDYTGYRGLLTTGSSIFDVQSSVGHSAEADLYINKIYVDILGRDAGDKSGFEGALGSGYSQDILRAGVGFSTEATIDITSTFLGVTGYTIDGTLFGSVRADLINDGNVAQAASLFATSDTFKQELALDWEQTLGLGPTSDQLTQESMYIAQQASSNTTITWNSVAGAIGNGVLSFLQQVNPLSTATAATRGITPEQQSANLAAAQAALSSTKVVALLNVISEAEGGSYNTLPGVNATEHTFNDYSHYPRTSSAGAYQIAPDLYNVLSKELGLSDFSPPTQDLLATWQLIKLGAIDDLSHNNLPGAISKASRTWAAVPEGAGANDHSHFPYYSGPNAGLPQPSMRYSTFLTEYARFGGR